MEILKSDWKLYRSRIGEWQEAYMEKLVKEYVELLSTDERAPDKFWGLEKRIKQDRKHPGVIRICILTLNRVKNFVTWKIYIGNCQRNSMNWGKVIYRNFLEKNMSWK